MTGIKAIIFDLGNVLVDFDHRVAAQRISKFADKTAEEIFGLFFDSELTGLFEEGKITAGQFFLKLKEALNLRLGYRGFLPIWNQIFFLSKKNRGVYELARRLKRRYRMALLTNINILHFEYQKKNFSVFDPFDNILTSYELGLRKPQSRIYERALDILGLPAEEVFYTDDRPELIGSAKELGINGFVFSGVEQLKRDLALAGVNIN